MTRSAIREDRVQPSSRVRALAEAALQNSGLKPPADQRETVVDKLARALANTPAKSEHGQLLVRALRPGKGPRPKDERIVRRLVGYNGDPPYAHVVGQLLDAEGKREERAAWRNRVVAKVVAEDGPRAAAFVAQCWQETGAGPTWHQLSSAMGWPSHPKIRIIPAIIHGLAKGGWLRAGKEPNSLQPGPRVQVPNGQASGAS
jgi:hypothetical protein